MLVYAKIFFALEWYASVHGHGMLTIVVIETKPVGIIAYGCLRELT